MPLKRKRLFKTFANSKDFFMTKNSWVIFNQFKVLLLLDGFVASIKIEYDVFTTKTGLLTLLSLSWIILRLQWGCYQPNFLLIIKILFQFCGLTICLIQITEAIFCHETKLKTVISHYQTPVWTMNHTHSCFSNMLKSMSRNLKYYYWGFNEVLV